MTDDRSGTGPRAVRSQPAEVAKVVTAGASGVALLGIVAVLGWSSRTATDAGDADVASADGGALTPVTTATTTTTVAATSTTVPVATLVTTTTVPAPVPAPPATAPPATAPPPPPPPVTVPPPPPPPAPAVDAVTEQTS